MFNTHFRRSTEELAGPESACCRTARRPADHLLERRAGSRDTARHGTIFTVIDHVHGRRWARHASKLDDHDVADFERALFDSLDGAVHGHAIGLPRAWLRHGTGGTRIIVSVFDDGLELWFAATGAHILLDLRCPVAEFLRTLMTRPIPSCWCTRRPLLTFGPHCALIADPNVDRQRR